MIKQVSVFMQNEEGELGKVLKTLAAAGVNIRSLTIAESTDYGILRLILQDPDKGVAALRGASILANTTQVLAVQVPDTPGGMASIVEALSEAGIDIAYAYSFLPKNTDDAIIILNVRDSEQNKAIETLSKAKNIELLTQDTLLTR